MDDEDQQHEAAGGNHRRREQFVQAAAIEPDIQRLDRQTGEHNRPIGTHRRIRPSQDEIGADGNSGVRRLQLPHPSDRVLPALSEQRFEK